jgi:predicted phage terminase large subunit-like protein
MSGLDINSLTTEQLDRIKLLLKPRWNKYMTSAPTAKQSAFLALTCEDAFYGGAAGGGKSEALLMAALQYVDMPNYNAVIIRKSYADLSLPGAIMDRARQYLSPWTESKEIRWIDKLKTFIFPSGARLSFGFLDSEGDKFKFQGAEFQFIGVDETSQISETNFLYMFSRLRKKVGNTVPLRFRSASNPSSEAMWLYNRYISPEKPDRAKIFIPSGIDDNPFLNKEEYKKTLENLDAVTREQLLNGSWTIKQEGGLFKPDWWKFVDIVPARVKFVRAWDLASSDPAINKRADYTVGCKVGRLKPRYFLDDIKRMQGTPAEVDKMILNTAIIDGRSVPILLPIDPGSAGQVAFEHYVRLLSGFVVKGKKNTGSKADRAKLASSACENGLIYVRRATWNKDFIEEASLFPAISKTIHDDQVDAFSWGFNGLQTKSMPGAMPTSVGESNSYWK